jgi:sigma-E factor negative regulatory protein RseB
VSPRRLSGGVVVAVVLLVALPTVAQARTGAAVAGGAGDRALGERAATRLLERAASAGRRLEYRGVQHVTVWRGGSPHRTTARLTHDPASGSVLRGVTPGPGGAHPAASGDTAVLDPRLVDRLTAAYDLSVRGPVSCAGRTASLVEARRGDGQVAGRFWVDRDSGLLLRREVYDATGRRARSTALVDLSVEAVAGAGSGPAAPRPTSASQPAVDRLRKQGWPVPERLPGGFRLIEARLDDRVLQLAYTDGLSTLSVFAQPGGLDEERLDGFVAQRVDGWPVLVHPAPPERVVWADGERVYTVVSDAPEPAVLAVVGALPHDVGRQGLLGRLERGTVRLARMLTPLD